MFNEQDKDLIFKAYRGSHARGMSTPESDVDFIGCWVAPLEHYFGFGQSDSYQNNTIADDVVFYEFRKLVKLLADSNPNVLEILWTPQNKFQIYTPIFEKLRNNRNLFLSKKIYTTFTGYATGQLKRLTSLTPQDLENLERLETVLETFGVNMQELNLKQSERTLVVTSWVRDITLGEILDEYVKMKHKFFPGGRLGQRRKDIIKKVGFDSKNASTLIMLLTQCVEALRDGEIKVDRSHDREMLWDIRNGKWTLAEVLEKQEELFRTAEELVKVSALPEENDRQAIEKLMVDVLKEHFSCNCA